MAKHHTNILHTVFIYLQSTIHVEHECKGVMEKFSLAIKHFATFSVKIKVVFTLTVIENARLYLHKINITWVPKV